MAEGQDVRYVLAPGCSWVADARGILVLDELARDACALGYPEAAIWELLLRGHSSEEAARLLQWIADLSPEEAQDLVSTRALQWVEAGWLQVAD